MMVLAGVLSMVQTVLLHFTCRFVKEKRPTISPNFNFLGQLLDFEKKIKTPKLNLQNNEVLVLPEEPDPCSCPGVSVEPIHELLEPLTLPCVLDTSPDERLLARALCGLQFSDSSDDSTRLKRSFSLDIKSFGEGDAAASHRAFGPYCGSGDSGELYRSSGFKEAGNKACQFSPVEEVSEQSTPERSPDKEEATALETPAIPPPIHLASSTTPKALPPAHTCSQPLQRSGSMEESAATYLFGLSHSQQHLSKPGPGGILKGWHSDILLGPVTTSTLAGSWYLSDSARFISTSAVLNSSAVGAYGWGHSVEAVRRRGRQRTEDRGDSRRSWHEESSFEKQLKRRSCQMEFGEGRTDVRSREDMVRAASQTSFSGSLEVIQVS